MVIYAIINYIYVDLEVYMEHIINVTHELEARDIRYYSIEKVMSSHMFDDFIKVENVSIEKWVSRRMLRVEGIVRLYGYKVEDGGFFDLINLKYYDKSSIFLEDAKIKSIRGEFELSKIKIKKKKKYKI